MLGCTGAQVLVHRFGFRGSQSFEFEGVPGHVLLQTVTFEPLGQKTRLVEQLVFQSVADRDGMVASGMQEGSDDSMERMDEILQNLRAQRA